MARIPGSPAIGRTMVNEWNAASSLPGVPGFFKPRFPPIPL